MKSNLIGVVLNSSTIIVLPFVGIAGTYGKWPMTNVGMLKILKNGVSLMIKTKFAALTLAGLMAVASGAAFAETSPTPASPVNDNATKLPGTNSAPADRNSSNTKGTQQGEQTNKSMNNGSGTMTHDKNTHGTHDKSGVTEKPKVN